MIRDYVINVPANQAISRSITGTYLYVTDLAATKTLRIEASSNFAGPIANLLVQQSSEIRTAQTFEQISVINEGDTDQVVRLVVGSGEYGVDSTPPIQTVSLGGESLDVIHESYDLVISPVLLSMAAQRTVTVPASAPNRKRIVLSVGTNGGDVRFAVTSDGFDTSKFITLAPGTIFDEKYSWTIYLRPNAATVTVELYEAF